MYIWDDMLTDIDRIVIEKGHYGQSRGLGKRPALIVIDLQPNYVGDDKPIEQQLDQWPSGGGDIAWAAVRRILSLRDAAREAGIPIFYTKNEQKKTMDFDIFANKTKRDQSKYLAGAWEADLLECIKPLPNEMVITKPYPSAFYGTPFQSYLVSLGIDTLIVTGGSTCGCCRMTAVEAVTRGYHLAFVQDCLYDRIELSHKASLFDVWMKYGDVPTSAEVKEYRPSLWSYQRGMRGERRE